jgi:hypothetical protein
MFWWVQANGIAIPAPCLPGTACGAIYQLADNQYLVDNSGSQLPVATRPGRRLAATQAATSVAEAVAAQADAVVALIQQLQAQAADQESQRLARTTGMGVLSPDGSGLDNPQVTTNSAVPFDYGTNLWIIDYAVAGGYLNGIGTNTVADVPYEIQSRTNLAQSDWQSEGFIYGSELSNWTPLSVAQANRTNLFIRLKSWASSDGSGLPDWWELLYFGTTGVDPYGNPAGDGYGNWQKFQNGMNPNLFYTPAAPQGLTATLNQASQSATISWLPSPGAVTNYLVTKDDEQSGLTTDFNVLPANDDLVDDLSGDQQNPDDLSAYGPGLWVNYSVTAQYTGGNSAASQVVLRWQAPPTVATVRGPQGSLYLAVSGLPANLTGLKVYRAQDSPDIFPLGSDLYTGVGNYFFGYTLAYDALADGYFEIPATNLVNGLWRVPTNEYSPFGSYDFWVQGELANGTATDWSANFAGDDMVATDPFLDARQQLKDNLRFLLRAADRYSPFTFAAGAGGWVNQFLWATNYVYASCYCSGLVTDSGGYGPVLVFCESGPIEDNYALRNFVYDPNSIGSYGFLDTGIYYSYFTSQFGPTYLFLTNTPAMEFNVNSLFGSAAPTVPASLLSAAQSRWIIPSRYVPTTASERNLYGLPYLSINATTGRGNSTVYAPVTVVTNGVLYVETAQPGFTNAGYYFARPIWYSGDPMPEQPGFAVTNVTPLIIQAIGTSQQIAGYAKLAVTNGYPGVYGYLGQYFDQAYQMDNNGNVTSTHTGMLSPYGDFFATEAGPAALVTMPDIDTGERGTGVVNVISLALNKSRSGGMDLSFNGPDATSLNSPFFFWCDNNCDRWLLDTDDNALYEDDLGPVDISKLPAYQRVPDCNYLDAGGNRTIPSTRDLEDFARLWVCGITTNLLASLPANSTVTLSWGDVGNPNSGNPTIDLFSAVDPDGGIGYLTNASVSAEQINANYIGRLGPGQSIQLNSPGFVVSHWAGNHFIWCGVSNGIGGLTLTISDASGNTLAQTTAYIQIQDIKQMYERWTVGDQPTVAPKTNVVLATEGLPAGTPAFQYPQPQDTNTSYILFVHGWNMETWEKDRYAETAFKRLYWQGYQGRFGIFRWPTDYGFTGQSMINVLLNLHNYDGSEFRAWQAAQGLANKLNGLNTEYPGHVYLLAHSMGNVVAGEALRLAAQNGLGQLINTYVASQAAIPAHVYDLTVTAPHLIDYTLVAHGIPAPGHPLTPNIYGNRLTNNIAVVGRRISFYNVNDYALKASAWCWDQEHKPDHFLNGYYHYTGSTSDPAPWNNFEFILNLGDPPPPPLNLDIVNNLDDRYNVLAYAANPYSTALGATPDVAGFVNGGIDLTDPNNHIWPSDANNYQAHFWHSAEFRGDNALMQSYWTELLSFDGFNLK